MKIKIHYSLLGLLLVFLFTGLFIEFFIFLIIIIAHEAGHILACYLFSQKIKALNLTIVGGMIDVQIENLSILKKIIIYFAGVLVNIIFLFSINFIKNEYYQKVIFNYNLLLIIFNLLPIFPLDGFRIIESIIYLIYNPFKEQKILVAISFISLIAFTIWTILYMNSFAYYIIVTYLWYHNISLKQHNNEVVLKKIIYQYRYLE